MASTAGATFDDLFALRPALHARYREFLDLLWSRRLVDPVLLELCRLRVAQLLGCEPAFGERHPVAVAAGLAEEKVRALARWRDEPVFQPLERAALVFAEEFVLAPHDVTDGDVAALVTHLTPPEVVALAEALAFFDGFTRFRTMLGTT
jgi:alkylhydroperoxidase family enzyme